ncbi:MAG: hypothetical protein HY556_08445 [Euryarchaeota archaeon]|nr:hypothetical protein [Euryarchaeota archaeon]
MASPFNAAERRLIKRLSTPLKIQRWLRTLSYDYGGDAEAMRSFRRVVRDGNADCIEGALAAAAILESQGHAPLLLDLLSEDDLNHGVALFKTGGKWGSVGLSRDPGLDGRKPVYASAYHLACSYYAPYVDEKSALVAWGVFDLRKTDIDWRFAETDLWGLEDVLDGIPHAPMRRSRESLRRLRARHRRWSELHPGKHPAYYRNKAFWL